MTSGKYIRILPIANGGGISGGWLDRVTQAQVGRRLDLLFDYREFCALSTPVLVERDGSLFERVYGCWKARRLRFCNVTDMLVEGLYTKIDAIPANHPARSLRGFFHWRTLEGDPLYIMLNGAREATLLQFSALGNRAEACPPCDPTPCELERDFSPTPQQPTRRVAVPGSLAVHQRCGGDPITFHWNGKRHPERLYVGGLEHHTAARPQVDAVLNLTVEPSGWTRGSLHPADRWSKQGEGYLGMSLDQIETEAAWVVERLTAGQRVLVHCWAGMNRSATICCAALIKMEGISAEQALERVRVRHPWALPDTHHWLRLRFLAEARKQKMETHDHPTR